MTHQPETAAQLAALVRDFLDPDPCALNHHGYCQAHGWLCSGRCPHARAREVLAAYDSASSAGVAPATDQTALRDRIAEMLRPHASLGGTPLRWELPLFDGATPSLPRISGWRPLDDVVDAIAAVLPASVDRADVLREAADRFDQHAAQLLDGVGGKAVFVAKALRDQAAVWSEAAETLRRLADEARTGQPEDSRTAVARVERLALTFEVSGNEFIAEQIRAAAAGTEGVPCVRPDRHPAHLHSGLRKGQVVHGRCPGVGTPTQAAVGVSAAAEPADETTAADVAHALDNSTPYPVELQPQVLAFMADRMLEMLTIRKRPEHAVWQPEEPPSAGPEPEQPPLTVAYSGKGRVWCLTCPRPVNEDVPVGIDVLQPYEQCAGCGRDVVDVAAAQQPKEA
jgi:hypothetical protein